MRIVLSFCLLLLSAGVIPAAAHAESVTYTFVGTDGFAGSSFSYIDPNGFLSFPTGPVAPTTAGDLFYAGVDNGPITDFYFFANTGDYGYTLAVSSHSDGVGFPSPYSLNTFGSQVLTWGILTIEPTNAATTPEPSSLLLLGTGVLGLAGAARRKFLNA